MAQNIPISELKEHIIKHFEHDTINWGNLSFIGLVLKLEIILNNFPHFVKFDVKTSVDPFEVYVEMDSFIMALDKYNLTVKEYIRVLNRTTHYNKVEDVIRRELI